MHDKMESGHSLMELLAFLAVIGILSIVGAIGLRALIEQHKVDTVISDVNLMVSLTLTQHDVQYPVFPDQYRIDALYPMVLYRGSDLCRDSGRACLYQVEIDKLPPSICRKLINLLPEFKTDGHCPETTFCTDEENALMIGFSRSERFEQVTTGPCPVQKRKTFWERFLEFLGLS